LNIEGVDFLFDSGARSHVNKNINFIVDRIRNGGSPVIDCSFDIDRFGFFNELDPTEHLNEFGRNHLHNKIVDFIGA